MRYSEPQLRLGFATAKRCSNFMHFNKLKGNLSKKKKNDHRKAPKYNIMTRSVKQYNETK